jgi:hypothetical protein
MDNSMHELGHALLAGDLLRAARKINADTVIAPDRLGEPEWNAESFHSTFDFMGSEFHIGVVMAGRDAMERASYLHSVQEASMLLLPFRENRLLWFLEQEEWIVSKWKRIHLLGVNTLHELQQFVFHASRYPEIDWSIDTAKPIKAAVAGRRIDDGQSLRNSSTSSFNLLNLTDLSADTLRLVDTNISLLKQLVSGEAYSGA